MGNTKFVCWKVNRWVCILLVCILLQVGYIGIQVKQLEEEKSFQKLQQEVEKMKQEKKQEELREKKNQVQQQKQEQETEQRKQEEEKKNKKIVMPQELKGYEVIGKITIPKLNLDSYILAQTNDKALKVSITKLYGPDINQMGNLCLAGHNYRNNKMFGGIKKLEENDEIMLTDLYGETTVYKVYQNYQIDPKDVSCLSQDTAGEKELTMITCSPGAIKRVIVKAVEDYD